MLRFDIITIFPEFFRGVFDFGIVRRARAAGLVEIAAHDLRGWTHDRHKVVDDRPFGGGDGMVLKPEPIFEAVESLTGVTGGAERLREAGQARRAALAAGATAYAEARGGVGGGRAGRRHLRPLRGRGRARVGDVGDRRGLHRRLRPVGRRARGGRAGGRSDAAHPGRSGERDLGGQRVLLGRAFSTSRTTRAPSSSAAGACRKFCSAATTRRSRAGAAARPCARRAATAPTSSRVSSLSEKERAALGEPDEV